jgi:trehalose 2-sulfotransferase
VPAVDPPRSYLICGTPRTGSTLLCGLLAATGVAGKPESYFRLPDEPSYAERWGVELGPHGPLDYWAYVRAATAAGSTPNGVFAARVMWGTMEEVVGKLRAACRHPVGTDLEVLQQQLGETRFVHLQRGDVLAQAVSWAKAEQTGYWQDGDSLAPGRRPRFDFNDVDGYAKTINEHNAAWREWFDSSAIAPLVVFYEALVADMAAALGRVLQFLGLEVPVGHVVEAPTRQQADEANRDWTGRYRSRRRLGL